MIEAEMMTRYIRLTKGWYRNYCGDIQARTQDGEEVRLVSSLTGGYRYYDRTKKKYCRVNARNQKMFVEDAVFCYRPLPENANFKKLLGYMIRTLNIQDIVCVLLATVMVTLAGVLYPPLTNMIYNRVIPSYRDKLLFIVLLMFLAIIFIGTIFAVIKNYVLAGIEIKMSTLVEAAFLGRCMTLPVSFYKKYPSGQISEWLECVPQLCSSVSSLIFGTWISSLLSLLYIFQIHRYVPAMVLPAVLIVIIFYLVCSLSVLYQTKWMKKQLQSNSRLTGLLYDLMCGIEKIKLENARKRAMQMWFEQYDEVSSYTYAPPVFVRISPMLPVLLSSLAGIAVLLWAKAAGMTGGEYMIFYSSFGLILGSIMAAAQSMNTLVTIKPQYEMLKNILAAEPEYAGTEDLEICKEGPVDIEVENVSFGYDPERLILKNLSVQIPYGDYVAIVGSTGCGKSTLLRLLLGFEKPQEGKIRYNGIDFEKQNPMSIRSRIGVVLQNDRLLPGSILENMRMANPDATEEEIWDVLEIAGMADDVRAMPMRLETLVGERNVFSGGQTQRLHIARAILGKPAVMIMDEATSALDNETQATISEEMDKLHCTRILVAHRLSTIRNCRRILVLDQGKIVEDGTYDELMALHGKFCELVNRQM